MNLSIFEYTLSNFGSFSQFQTFLSLGVEQGLHKLPEFDLNDLRLSFHYYILIPRKCLRKTPFQHTVPSPLHLVNVVIEWLLIRYFSSVNCIVYLSVYKSFRQALFTFKRLSNSPEYPMEINCSRAEENAPGGSRYAYCNYKYPKQSYKYTFLQ